MEIKQKQWKLNRGIHVKQRVWKIIMAPWKKKMRTWKYLRKIWK